MQSSEHKKFPVVPYGCLFIDATWRDVLSAVPFSLEPNHHRSLMEHKIEELWNRNHGDPDPILISLSVRSALDAFLLAKQYPPGSEVIFTAINIPDMARIVRHHGLTLVSVDVDTQTLAPKIADIEALITPRTVAILVAHIYGRQSDIDAVIRVARQHNLVVLEDCAENFCGIQNHGHPGADISFFSFGLIKFSTAFGGGISVVRRNPTLLRRMRTISNSYPVQSRSTYLKRVLKYALIMTALNSPFLVKNLTILIRSLGVDHHDLIVRNIRGFPTDFVSNIRRRPSIALLCMMYRRLKKFDFNQYNLGNIKGEFVTQRLPPGVKGVGLEAKQLNYWLYPIIVNDPERIVKELNARGVDAYRGATQLDLVESDVASLCRPNHPQELSTLRDGTRANRCPHSSVSEEVAASSNHNIDVPVSSSSHCGVGRSVSSDHHSNMSNSQLMHLNDDACVFEPRKEVCIQSSMGSLYSGGHTSSNKICDDRELSSPWSSIGQGDTTKAATVSCMHKSSMSARPSKELSGIPFHNDNSPAMISPLGDSTDRAIPVHQGTVGGVSDESSETPLCTTSNCLTPIPLSTQVPSLSSTTVTSMSPTKAAHNNAITQTVPCNQHTLQSTPSTESSNSGKSHSLKQSAPFSQPTVLSAPATNLSNITPTCTPSSRQGAPLLPSQERVLPQGKYPSEARHLIDHVVYLPVHRKVPFYYLEIICIALDDVVKTLAKEKECSQTGSSNNHNVHLKSKL